MGGLSVYVWRSKFACDITVSNYLALENTQLLRDYASIDPRLRQLGVALKYWAKQR